MAENLAQTMTTLAADSRDMKTSLRLMLKYEIQSLLDRLSDLGEDSVLLLANTSEGTSGHLGSLKANNFLSTCNQSNVNLKDNFLKFCSGVKAGHTQEAARNTLGMTDINCISGFTRSTLPQAQGYMDNIVMNQSPGNIPSLLDGIISFPSATSSNRFNFFGNTGTGEMFQSGGGENKGRKKFACRHFVGKGHCWQGNNCSFLHTRDPEILKSLKGNSKAEDETAKEPATGSGQTDGIAENSAT